MFGVCRHRVEEGRVEEAVLQHEAHRAFLDLGGVEVQEERRGALARAAVAGLDLQDRLRLVGHARPRRRWPLSSRFEAMASA